MTASTIFPPPPSSPGRAGVPRLSKPRKQPPQVVLPGFVLRRVVGTGGVGVVYEGWDEKLARTVAVKLLHSGGRADPLGDERFRYEAQLVARLRHPGIVQPYQFGEVDGVSYLVMEFVDGPNLHEAAAGRPADPWPAAGLVRTAAEAVGFAHREGVIHRDLKPGNILLAGPDLAAPVRVTDFGMARLMADGPDHSPDGTVAGTPGYMAPEQCVLNGPIGPWTDVYALGVILYELLTGKLPVPADPPEAYLRLVQRFTPLPPRSLDRAIPADLESICLKCLASDPRSRYLSADDLAADLQQFLDGKPVAARPLGTAEGVARAVRDRPVAAGLAAVAALGLAAAAVVATVSYLWAEDRRRQAELATIAAEQARREAVSALDAEAAARRDAETARRNADAISQFLIQDLLQGNRDMWGRPAAAAKLTDVLLAAGPSAERRFRDTPRQRAEVEAVLARALETRTEYAAAARHWQKAADAAEAAHGPVALSSVRARVKAAFVGVLADDPSYLRPAAEAVARMTDRDTEQALQLRVMLAMAYYQSSEWSDGLVVIDDAAAAAAGRHGPDNSDARLMRGLAGNMRRWLAEAAVAGPWRVPSFGRAARLADPGPPPGR